MKPKSIMIISVGLASIWFLLGLARAWYIGFNPLEHFLLEVNKGAEDADAVAVELGLKL
jgi:hypothetical protein